MICHEFFREQHSTYNIISLGATHFGALETESSANSNGKMSSIDMAPSLFQKVRFQLNVINNVINVPKVMPLHNLHYH